MCLGKRKGEDRTGREREEKRETETETDRDRKTERQKDQPTLEPKTLYSMHRIYIVVTAFFF
jgi:hypothetical protein